MKSKNFKAIIILLLIAILMPVIVYATDNTTNTTNNLTTNETNNSSSKTDEIVYATEQGADLEISTDAAILIDSSTGAILYSKNAEETMYPASTTKILTAILVIENGNLDDITTVSASAVEDIPSGYSSSYLTEGEQISISSLLKALFLHSSNDATNVLAEYVSGSIEEFVNLMNTKAEELGCTDSNFVNTNGIANENHYSTAKDLAIIAQYCMQNSTFRKYTSMLNGTISATNKFDEERSYTNSNALLLETSEYYREDCIGIKTGFTSEAQYCLIAACSNEDTELITVTLHSDTAAERYTDTITLFDYGYEVMNTIDLENSEDVTYIIEQEQEEVIDTSSSVSTENLFTQSFWEYLIKSDILIIILRTALGIIILLIIVIILIKKSRKKKTKYIRKH